VVICYMERGANDLYIVLLMPLPLHCRLLPKLPSYSLILDSDLIIKNFQGLILALNNIVHLCSMHWPTTRSE